MIQKMSHATIYVLDQDLAKDFYVDKLGFDLKADYSAPNGFRWLAVAPKGQTEVEIALLRVGTGADSDRLKGGSATETAKKDIEAMAALLKKGWFSAGVFHTADCRKTFAELKAKGVEFVSEPKDEFFGVVAVFKDPFGNWFSMSQPKSNR
ncbi:MAG TPA: VOC family protein [Candidatus Sulfotelmatobacter sp.]|jgi:catechol 2,3-dioxygenase-like lactoylglutathione lyase family enzyme